MQRVRQAIHLNIFIALTSRFRGFARTQTVQVELYVQIHTCAILRSFSKRAIRVAVSPPAKRDICARSGTCEAPFRSASVSLVGYGIVGCRHRCPSTLHT